MVTCSSIGRAVETAAELVATPVLRVDRPMAEQAVARASRIGVVATLPTTLEQRTLLEEYGGREGSLAVVASRRGSREILGTLTLASGRSRRTEHAAELSMGVGRAWWGRGIGALLMGAGLTWASRSHILKRVSLSVFHDNEVARRLYERVGFATEGVLRRYVRIGERREDLVVMGLWLGGEL